MIHSIVIKNIIIFTLGVIIMRSAGCVINDFADKDIDGHVERTLNRPMATGTLSSKDALLLFAALGLTAFTLVLMVNPLTIYLSFGGIALAVLYPFMKRYTYLPQVVLGAAFSWAIPMAFAAQTNSIPSVAWLIYTANLLWTVAYDTQYAMVDRDDDIKIGVKSTAILFGDADRLMIALLQATAITCLILLGVNLEFTWPWYGGLIIASGLFAYQHHLTRNREKAHCFEAFLNNHWVGLVIFLGLTLNYSL